MRVVKYEYEYEGVAFGEKKFRKNNKININKKGLCKINYDKFI